MNNAIDILHKYWGYATFRHPQEEIIESILNNKDTLALMPTGGGKSITYQVPAMIKPGLCLVISPLIALMKDQVDNLKKLSINASLIFSGMRNKEIDIILDNCIYGKTKFLYISPERIQNQFFQTRIQKMKINLIAVDEAHCISQWGYDFRPSYLKINTIRKFFPTTPVLALTATATKDVVKDIQEKLNFKRNNVIRASFIRKNLSYNVVKDENKYARLLRILNKIKGSTIIYVRNRKNTKYIYNFLESNKISATYYNAGMNYEARQRAQEDWIKNKKRVMVATNAFGMGIDKSNVRLVIHFDLPDSLESYFQEAGRAGRDGQLSYAILLFEDNDIIKLNDFYNSQFPDNKFIKRVYDALGSYFNLALGSGKNISFPFKISDFVNKYKLPLLQTYNSLKWLEKENYIAFNEAFYNPSKIHFLLNKNELYEFQILNPKLDLFIKTILRSYGGAFNNYIKIDENVIAKRLSTSTEKVKKLFIQLSKHKIIDYLPRNEDPHITFLSERIDANYLNLNSSLYKILKNQANKRKNSVIDFVSNDSICRSKFLLNYFGEKQLNNCGICDVCRKQVNNNFLKEIQYIEKKLKEKKETLDNILNNSKKHFDNQAEKKLLDALRWLQDNGYVYKDEKNFFHWKENN